ncbi:MAG: hypothetical protein ACUZ8E_17515 [Candidatus Anammoxibacter sp.]
MNPFDLHNKVKVLNALDSQTIATDTTTNGEIIDTAAFHALEFILKSGAVADGDFTVALQHGDDSGLSDAATVAAADLLGSIVFLAADDDAAKRIGYIGKKRFVRMTIVSDNTSSGGVFSGVALQGNPLHAPVANQ